MRFSLYLYRCNASLFSTSNNCCFGSRSFIHRSNCGVSPIIRRQLREGAEANARVQSHLVETLSGMETVKGQEWSYQVNGDGSNFMEDKLKLVLEIQSQVQQQDQQSILRSSFWTDYYLVRRILVLDGN